MYTHAALYGKLLTKPRQARNPAIESMFPTQHASVSGLLLNERHADVYNSKAIISNTQDQINLRENGEINVKF